jgi:hypothetical protein
MLWKPFIYQDKTYSLKHLHPFQMEVIQGSKGDKPERKYDFQVSFSLHCFSRKELADEENIELRYKDSRETRIFCYERYELSKKLPEIIRNISKNKCLHTGYGNFFIVEILTENGRKQNYEVYFTVKKAQKVRLSLYIQSAYIRDEKHQQRRKKKPIGFYVIAFNTLHNKKIRVPK